MRNILRAALAFAATAGLAGAVHAVKPFTESMDTVTGKSGHISVGALPDVSKTPSAPAPVPIPYPNMGMKDEGATAKKKNIKKAPVQNKSTVSRSNGDEAGTLKGVVSVKNMDKATHKTGGSKVKAEGIMLTPLGSMTGHNGSSANVPPGLQIAPSQTNVIMSDTAVPDAAKPRTAEDTGPRQIPAGAIPAPAVLQRAAPLTPIARPVFQPTPLPARTEPVKVPQPIIVQPVVQPKPMITLQPRTVLTR